MRPSPHSAQFAQFQCHLLAPAERLPHFWEHTVGSGHATLALRADWQRQITRCHDELGFRYVRFHGLLSDDMGTLVKERGELVYSFFNADQVFDFLVGIGMRPFVELSFMPTALASGSDTVFHYQGNVTPPDDYGAWRALLGKLLGHWATRYGVAEIKNWFFEVWNEPNLKAFWTGTQKDYFKLYEASVYAIKDVHPELKVGGPATAKNAWIPEFVAHCAAHGLPVDFISTHHYPTDAFGQPGDDTVEQLAASERSVLRKEARQVFKEAHGKPVYYTEWSSSSNPFDELHDAPYAAAFAVKTVLEARGLVEAYSYWTFSDIFEENYFSSQPFHGGFGLLNIHGIPKPVYRAYELLHRLGDELLPVEGRHATVDVWVTREEGRLKVMATNHARPRHAIRTETVRLSLRDLPPVKSAYLERVDENHANPAQAWQDEGSPGTLSPRQIASLERASELRREEIVPQSDSGFDRLGVYAASARRGEPDLGALK